MKRFLSLVLVALMLLSLFACANDSTPGDDTTASTDTTAATEETTTETTKLVADLPEKKMNGFAFKVFSSDTSGKILNFPTEEIGEEINDAVYRHNSKLQEQYDFVLTIDSNPSGHDVVSGVLRDSSLAGDNPYQLYLVYTKNMMNYLMYYLPFNNLTYVDYTMPWWFPDASKSFNIEGLQMSLSGCFDITMPLQPQLLAFNKELVAEMNLPKNLYDLVRDGEWTYDKFAEVGTAAARDLNGDGTMDANDRTGIQSHWKGYYSAMINAGGVPFATTDEQGYPVFKGSADTTLIDTIQKLKNLATNNPNLYRNAHTKNNYTYEGPKFANAQTLLTATNLSSFLGSLRDLDFEVGAIPWPKATVEQDRYYAPTAYGHSPVLSNSLPKDQWENVGILMEAFAFDTYDEILPVLKERALKTKSASDAESADMIDLVWDSVYYDFGVLCWEAKIADKVINELFKDNGDNIVSFLTSLEPTILQETQKIKDSITAVKEAAQ